MIIDRERIAACDEDCLVNTMGKQLRRRGIKEDSIQTELVEIVDAYRKIKFDEKNSPLTFSEFSSLKQIELTTLSCNCHKKNQGFGYWFRSIFHRNS